MRLAHVLTLAGAAALSLSAAAAPANTDSMHTVNVAHATYKLHASDLDAARGTYALDDGRTLRVSAEHRKLYAEVDGVKKELVKVGATRFASRDDAVRVTFDAGSAGNDVTLSTAAPR